MRAHHPIFGYGQITDETPFTYRILWETYRTATGRNWSHVNRGSVRPVR